MKAGHIVIAMLWLFMTGCAVNPQISDTYPEFVASAAETALPATSMASGYILTDRTAAYQYRFTTRFGKSPQAWVVDVGKVLDASLQAPATQQAFGSLTRLTSSRDARGNVLLLDVKKYVFEDARMTIALDATLFSGGKAVFTKTYSASGSEHGARLFQFGTRAVPGVVNQSTRVAIDDILARLIADLNASANP